MDVLFWPTVRTSNPGSRHKASWLLIVEDDFRHQISALPFILMTGAADVQHAVLAMKSGGADYIARPYQPDILLPRIREALHTGTLQPTAAGASPYHLYNVRIRHKMS